MKATKHLLLGGGVIWMLLSMGCYTVLMLPGESERHIVTEENVVEEEYDNDYESEETQTVIHEHYYYGDLWPGTIYFDPFWSSPYWWHYSSWYNWSWRYSWYYGYAWWDPWPYGYGRWRLYPYYTWYYWDYYPYYDPYWVYYDGYYGNDVYQVRSGTSLGERTTYGIEDVYSPSATVTRASGATSIGKAGENSGAVVTKSVDERSIIPSSSAASVTKQSDSGTGTATPVRRVGSSESDGSISSPRQPESSSVGTVKRVESNNSSSSSAQRSSSSSSSSSSNQTISRPSSSSSSRSTSTPSRTTSSGSATRSSSSAGSSSSGSVTRSSGSSSSSSTSSGSSSSSSNQSSGTVNRR
ncbi:hypothetical protein JW824_03530 [bacterium]|nr:hypothetical protein [bacterium]